jgi:hypothetical protein
MLGVQRTTITVVARALQAAGLIRCRRGVVDSLDRAGLEAIAGRVLLRGAPQL